MAPVHQGHIGYILQFIYVYKELDISTGISIVLNLVPLQVLKGSWPSKATCRQT